MSALPGEVIWETVLEARHTQVPLQKVMTPTQETRQVNKVNCKVSCRLPSSFSKQEFRVLLYTTSNTTSNTTTNTTTSNTTDGSSSTTDRGSTLIDMVDGSTPFHLVLLFGSNLYSESLETLLDDDTPQSREMRGARPVLFNNTQNCTAQKNTTQKSSQKNTQQTNQQSAPPLVRIHSSCFTGETLGSLRCDCAEQLHTSISQMSSTCLQDPQASALLVYLHQEGRGIGLLSKLFAYNLIDTKKHDTVSANVALGYGVDEREYKVAALILKDLNVLQCRLMTNNPDKVQQLEKNGVDVIETIGMVPHSWTLLSSASGDCLHHHGNGSSVDESVDVLQDRDGYLVTKIKKMGHNISIPGLLETLLTTTTADTTTTTRDDA